MGRSLISKLARAAGVRKLAFSRRGQVTMLETRKRLGGRVHALDSLLPGKRVEAGGEFIGLNHPTWLANA